jgi:molybdate transport system substrate-binding protein
VRSGPLFLLALLALLAPACGSDGDGETPSAEGELLVAAAAHLGYAFDEIGALFEAETGAKVTFSYGSSGLLATQIEGGLPADIFCSADTSYVDQIRERGLIVPGSERVYALGRLVLASSTKSGLALTELSDLQRPEVEQIAIANPRYSPYGRAAEEALKSAGLWDDLEPRIVYAQNMRQATQFVESGNAEAGLIPLSLAINSSDLTYVLVDDSLHLPIRAELAILAGTKKEDLARRFIALLNSPEGQAVMEKYGFAVPKEG